MSSEKFIKNKTALITLIAACIVVLISLGVRQTFGLFFMDFKDEHLVRLHIGLEDPKDLIGDLKKSLKLIK